MFRDGHRSLIPLGRLDLSFAPARASNVNATRHRVLDVILEIFLSGVRRLSLSLRSSAQSQSPQRRRWPALSSGTYLFSQSPSTFSPSPVVRTHR